MELEHSQLELADANEIPVFKGTEYEEHVNAWMEIDERVQDCYWKLGAVAASLVSKYGENVKGKFASDVGSSARRIREYAETYRRWQSGDRSPLLSFKHHTLAARSEDPQKAIETAEDEKLSTRELETFVKTGELPDREPEIHEEVSDVETAPGRDDIVKIVRAAAIQFVVEFGNGDRHTVTRDVLLDSGYKKCSCCGYGVVAPNKGEK